MVDLKPGLTEEMLRERIAREMAEMGPEEFFSELLRKLVPKALVIPLLKRSAPILKIISARLRPSRSNGWLSSSRGWFFRFRTMRLSNMPSLLRAA